MGKLPNAERAIVQPEKLRDYILCKVHPKGRYKTTFFSKLGYSAENWQVLEQDLRRLILSCDVTVSRRSNYGQKFSVKGRLTGPNGKTLQIISVWIILSGENVPRFVTAYYGGQRSGARS